MGEVTTAPATQPRSAAPRVPVPTPQRPQPGEQLRHLEGLDEVVLRPRVQPLHAIAQASPRRQDQHRRPDPPPPKAGDEVDPLHSGEPAIDHQHVVTPGQPTVQPDLSVGRQIDQVALGAEQIG